jgi:hypothetical protein
MTVDKSRIRRGVFLPSTPVVKKLAPEFAEFEGAAKKADRLAQIERIRAAGIAELTRR